MKRLKEFTIQFAGLKLGEHCFAYEIDNTFFNNYEYEDFNDIGVKAKVLLEKKSTLLELRFEAVGQANVLCDITNEPFDQPIENAFELVVKFGDKFNDDNMDILILPHGEHELNIAQYLYELIVLSMPTKRVHPGIADGTLDSEILKKLEELSPKGQDETDTGTIDPRWNTLKKLLTDK